MTSGHARLGQDHRGTVILPKAAEFVLDQGTVVMPRINVGGQLPDNAVRLRAPLGHAADNTRALAASCL